MRPIGKALYFPDLERVNVSTGSELSNSPDSNFLRVVYDLRKICHNVFFIVKYNLSPDVEFLTSTEGDDHKPDGEVQSDDTSLHFNPFNKKKGPPISRRPFRQI